MATIELRESVFNLLAAQAKAEGLTLEAYLEILAEARSVVGNDKRPRLTGEELERLIDAEAGPGNPAYHGTYSREDIYLDHD